MGKIICDAVDWRKIYTKKTLIVDKSPFLFAAIFKMWYNQIN